MEMTQLYQGLTFLAYATGIIIILVGGMLIAVLFNLTRLLGNLNETAVIVKEELSPTLKNLNKAVEIISGIIIKTDEGIGKVKSFVLKTPMVILSKLPSILGTAGKGFVSGLTAAFKMFGKKD